MTWTIPNILTTLRLLAAPGTAVMFLYFNRPWADWFALILFLGAALTDYFDGYLARLWKQESKFGAMMDPIADKAMVVIALLVITGISGMNPWLLLPSTVIMFREVVIPGLREFLGETSKMLAVTKLAKWKTTAQMVSIAVLFASGVGTAEDPLGLHLKPAGIDLLFTAGTILLWVAAVLTLITGWDYFVKAMPYLRDEKRR
jgi:CDP-diacylglycerol--glycerol-3-phosphate 3-phosphatidyltransferase